MSTTEAHLIERDSPAMFLAVEGSYNEYDLAACGSVFYWTNDASQAIRFCRRIDACMLLGSLRRLADSMQHRDVEKWLPLMSDINSIRVCYHVF